METRALTAVAELTDALSRARKLDKPIDPVTVVAMVRQASQH